MRSRHPRFGLLLMLVGTASVLSSAVPFFSNAVRITVREDL